MFSSALRHIDNLVTEMPSQRFLVMPLAFEGAKDESLGDKTGTAVAALALIGNAYLLSLILFGAQYRKRTYLIHSVFL